jgi:hypothetical protein
MVITVLKYFQALANVNVSGNNTHIEHLQINKAFKRED